MLLVLSSPEDEITLEGNDIEFVPNSASHNGEKGYQKVWDGVCVSWCLCV